MHTLLSIISHGVQMDPWLYMLVALPPYAVHRQAHGKAQVGQFKLC